ncbi:Phage integrase family protein [Phyllobacterium sp. YR620]|uniref:DUF6538 domain-containing protein n=1 Tax=Phyllobacterium sp. YR620 TaxID=1881066 RepID=UPI000890C457|nr:DUF6538 domain-containing protein [Phyllobacterium sp. YR620]SDP92232.1 Phage integrase family protein [Phyllobacterium sp. YR620]
MTRKREDKSPNRHLQQRNGNFFYKRRVPKEIAALDARGEHIRISLKTDDIAIARTKRDIYETADNEYWASLIMGFEGDKARLQYASAVKRAEALGFSYKPAAMLALEPIEALAQRFEAILDVRTEKSALVSVLGVVDQPAATISKAQKIFLEEIVPHELTGKSKDQRERWIAKKKRSFKNFIDLVGDKQLVDITRDDANKFYKYWLDKIAPKEGRGSHSPSTGNRDMGNLRTLYTAYFTYMGQKDRDNPFDDLNFSEKKKRKRPPFPLDWIKETILAPGALAGLNSEARGVLLVLIETGARMGEISNLTGATIDIASNIPHIKIEPREDPDDPREIKTQSSIRSVPLIGMALEALRKHPNGFPRYKDKETVLSNTLNKFFRDNELFPSTKHTIYSFRHAFEDRMKEAGIDHELRKILMGHTIDRPDYGIGGSMEWRMQELRKIELSFDPSIV